MDAIMDRNKIMLDAFVGEFLVHLDGKGVRHIRIFRAMD